MPDHHLDETRDIAHRGLVDGAHGGADRRRPHDAAMQHVGDAHVVHIFELPRDHRCHVETRHRLAEHRPIARRLAWRRGTERHVELPASDEFAIGDACGAIGSRTDDAIHDGQLLNRHGKTRGGEP